MFRFAHSPVLRIAGVLLFAITFCLLADTSAAVTAAPCTLQWNASPNPAVTGYAIYYGVVGTSTTNRFDAGAATSATLYTLTANTNYFFYVVAYNAFGLESPKSNVINHRPPVLSYLHVTRLFDGTMRVWFNAAPGTPCRIECTSSLRPAQWTTLGSATADSKGNVAINDPPAGRPATRFYRAAVKP